MTPGHFGPRRGALLLIVLGSEARAGIATSQLLEHPHPVGAGSNRSTPKKSLERSGRLLHTCESMDGAARHCASHVDHIAARPSDITAANSDPASTN